MRFAKFHRVDLEFENLRAAIALAEAIDDWKSIAEILSSLAWYWVLRGHLRECSAWLDRVEANIEQVPPATRIALRWSRVFISSHSGTDETVIRTFCEDLRAEAHAVGDLWHEGRALGQLAALEVFLDGRRDPSC